MKRFFTQHVDISKMMIGKPDINILDNLNNAEKEIAMQFAQEWPKTNFPGFEREGPLPVDVSDTEEINGDMEVIIVATECPGFRKIDNRIKVVSGFEDTAPTTHGVITFPKTNAEEILGKLNNHPRIMSINRKYTPHGRELKRQVAEDEKVLTFGMRW